MEKSVGRRETCAATSGKSEEGKDKPGIGGAIAKVLTKKVGFEKEIDITWSFKALNGRKEMSTAIPDNDKIDKSRSSTWKVCGIAGLLLSLLLSICSYIKKRPGYTNPFLFKYYL